jgi:hypothetical protein
MTETQDALKLLERARQILESSDNENMRNSVRFLRESIEWVQRAQQCDNRLETESIVQRPILNSAEDL